MANYIISSGEVSNGIIRENNALTTMNSGVMFVPDWKPQLIYLDFNGELTKYRNAELDLEIDDVQVEDSMLAPERIAGITASLNSSFSAQRVLFVTERPKDTAYSTIFIGKTSAFDQYGSFAGLAETVDRGNQRKDDNAFVLLNAADPDSDIVSTIAHEAGHLLGTLDHGGDALDRYAAYTYYYIQNNCTVTDLFYPGTFVPQISYFYLVHYSSDREYLSSSWSDSTSYHCVSSRYDKAADETVTNRECLVVNDGCFASNIKVIGGMEIYAGGSCNKTSIYSGGHVELNGIAYNTIVDSDGLLSVRSGGSANSTTVNKLAYVCISSGGRATAIRENGGYVYVSSGAYAAFVANSFSGFVYSNSQSASIHSATTALNASVFESAKIDVLGGTTISATVGSRGYLFVSGGTANKTTVSQGGMYVSRSGTANDTIIRSGGILHVSNGGTANSTTVSSGGSFYIGSSGTANSTTVSSGGFFCIANDGTITNTTINSMGHVRVNGGTANSTRISSGGSFYIASSGTANDTTINKGGRLFVSSGGTANSTTVSSGGSFNISSGGTANSTTVSSGGSFHISSGGKATGQMTFYKGAVVSAVYGSIIDFNIAENATGFAARVNDLSIVSGRAKANYTITVSDNQAKGVYVLAKGASDFNKTISVVGSSGETLGTLAAGKPITINGTDYMLNLQDDVLSLRIGDWEPARINYEFTDIGQTVYYDGEKPEDCTLEGVLMAIPYTADITISFDKSLGFGEYEFTTSVAEVPSSVNNCKIQIADAEGVPDLNGDYNKWSVAYISHDACCYGTKIGETDTTVTYQFTNVNDYVLIDSIRNKSLTLTNDYGESGGFVSLNTSSPKITFASGKQPDVNKTFLVTGLQIDKVSQNGEEKLIAINSSPDDQNNIYIYSSDLFLNGKKYEKINTEIEWDKNDDNQAFAFYIMSKNVLGYDICIDLNCTEKINTYTTSLSLTSCNIKDINLTDLKLKDIEANPIPCEKNHCWIAVACNMMAAGGYLSISAQECYNILSSNYFIKDNSSKSGNVTRVFYDLVLDKSKYYQDIMGVKNYYSHPYKIFDGQDVQKGLENIVSSLEKTIVGSINTYSKEKVIDEKTGELIEKVYNHGYTCYSVNVDMDKKKGTVTCADSDSGFFPPKLIEFSLEYDSIFNYWVMNNKEIVTSIITLISNSDYKNQTPLNESDIDRLEILSDDIEEGHIYAGRFTNVISNEGSLVVCGDIANSVIMEKGVLQIANGAEAEEMVVHDGGTVNFNSGAIAKGTIRTAGGTLTVESGVDVSAAEFDFAVSYMDGGNNTVLLNSLNNVSGSKLTITIVNGQSAGKYVLAGGAANFNGTLSVVGELDCLQDIGEGFKNGLIGELGLDNALYIEGKNYFLKLEEDELALMISSEGVSDIVVPSGGARVVSSGQVYIDTIVNSDGSMVVSSGGMVNDITLNPGGGLYVSSGGKMTGRMAFGSGTIVSAYDGAIVDFDLTQTSAGAAPAIINDLSVVKGRPVFTLTVDGTQSNGAYKLAEGTAGFGQAITIQNTSGDLLGTVSVGKTVRIADSDFTLFLSGDTLSLGINVDIIPPTAINVTASTAELTTQSVTVSAEFADNVAVASAFYRIGETGPWTAYENGVTVSENTTIYFKAIDASGNESEIVSYPVTNIINHTVISGVVTQNNIYVSSGQMYYDTVVNGCFMFVYSGGIANSTTLNSNGRLYISNGGAAYNTNAAGSGCLTFVSSGGVVNNTMLSGGGLLEIDGGRANNTTISSGGIFYISSDGVANSADIYSSGYLLISGGARASSVTVYKSGQLYVQSDSIANDTVLQGGVLFVASDGTVNSTTVNSGGWVILYEGGVMNNIMLSGGGLIYVSGGTANDTTLSSGGTLYVYSGGTANSTTVSSGGSMYFSSGGVAYNTTVSSGGTLYVSSGGTANDTTVNSGGTLYVYSGTAYGVKENGGYVNITDGANVTFAANSFSGLALSNKAKATIHSGTTAYNTTVTDSCSFYVYGGKASNTINSGGRLYVSSGGTADHTTVNYWGNMYVSSGGMTNDTTLSFGGRLYVSSGGIANYTTVSSDGYLYVSSGGTANDTTVNSGGYLYVSSGGTANDTTVNSGGYLYVSSGGTAYGVKENGGYIYIDYRANVTFDANSFSGLVLYLYKAATIHSGTTAYNTTVSSGGSLYIFSGGVANYTTVSSGGSLYVSGGVANNTTVFYAGSLYVSSGGIANYTTVSSDGYLYVSSGGTANKATVYSGGRLYLSGGMAKDTTVSSGGYLYVSSGGTANNTTVSSAGKLFVFSGGVANRTTVKENSYLYVYSRGGTANNTTVSSGGTAIISSGGKVTGQTTIENGAIVSAYEGAILDFDISTITPDVTARINDLSRLSGWLGAIFTLTVGESPENGTYTLAGGATGFNKTISVMNTSGVQIGSLSVGQKAILGDNEYMLNLTDGSLSITVSTPDSIAPIVTNIKADITTPTNGSVTLTATFSDNVEVAQSLYRIGENGEWRAYENGVTLTDNTTVYFKAVDPSGNESTEIAYEVTNIDKTPPIKPTASADITMLTKTDVTVTAEFSKDSAKKEYSLNGGETWQDYNVDGVIIIINGTVIFRATDEAGNSSETIYEVKNIDKVAPSVPSGLNAAVSDQTVALSWTASTDDLAGVKEYVVTYSHDGQEFTTTTTGTSFLLENADCATWQWSVQAVDNVGNVSEAAVGNVFTVEPEVVPEPETEYRFFPGCFGGGKQAMLAVQSDNSVSIYFEQETWGNGLMLDPGWDVVGVGDFDANGQDDFLRVNSEGYVVGEKTQANGTFEVQVLNFLNSGWGILGIGDFNGNGTDDVLIANPTAASETVGLLGYWESGVTWTLINGYSAEWECISTGDFNGDGKCDMLWRNTFEGDGGLTYNAYCTWIVEDPVDWRMVSVANPSEWNFLCSGDFNGDKMNDIAMINDVGVVGIWGVEDGWLSSWSILSAVTPDWQLAGVADFNGDGTDDIAWSNTESGQVGTWLIEDKTLANWQVLATLS